MRRRRIVGPILLVVILGVAGFVYWLSAPFWRIRSLQRAYEKVERGMTVSAVKAVMGTDGRPYAGPYRAWWDDRALDDAEGRRIRSALHYRVETFLLPVTFEVTFDDNGKVVGRHRYD